jgi:hypothetical protein
MFRLTLRTAETAAMFAACLVTAFFVPTYSWVPLPVALLAGAIIERRKKHL